MREINQFLVTEKGRLETDVGTLKQEVVWEREHIEKEKAEMTESVKKVWKLSSWSQQIHFLLLINVGYKLSP